MMDSEEASWSGLTPKGSAGPVQHVRLLTNARFGVAPRVLGVAQPLTAVGARLQARRQLIAAGVGGQLIFGRVDARRFLNDLLRQ